MNPIRRKRKKRTKIPSKDAIPLVSSIGDKISPYPTYPNQPWKPKNKNKKTENSPLKAGRIGAPSTYCIMQNADFQPKPNLFFQTQLLFFQTQLISFFFFFKTKENKKPSATKNGNFLDLLGKQK